MRFAFLLLLWVSVSLAAVNPNEVLLVCNPLCTEDSTDSDADAVADWRQVFLAWCVYYPTFDTTAGLCSVRTKCSTLDSALGSGMWGKGFLLPRDMHYDLDTSSVWDGVLGAGQHANYSGGTWDYVLTKIASHMTANNLWGTVKYIVFLPGFPHGIGDANGKRPQDDGSAYDSTCYKSLGAFIELFCHEGIEANGAFTWWPGGLWRQGRIGASPQPNGVITEADSANPEFIPGEHWAKRIYNPNQDSCRQWVLCSHLDGFHVDQVLAALANSIEPAFVYDPQTETWPITGYYVVDSPNPASDNYSARYWADATFRSNVYTDFGSEWLIYDTLGGTPSGNPDTITAHFCVSDTIDSVLFYSAHGQNDNPVMGKSWLWNLKVKPADGSLFMSRESYNAITFRDTLVACSLGTRQGQIAEAVKHGFTYGIGTCWEPYSSYAPAPTHIPAMMRTEGVNWGLASHMMSDYCGWQTVVFGNPLGVWMGYSDTVTLTDRSHGGCHNKFTISVTAPQDGTLDTLEVIGYGTDLNFSVPLGSMETFDTTLGDVWFGVSIDSFAFIYCDTSSGRDTTYQNANPLSEF